MAVRFCGCEGALDIRRQDLVRIITTSGSRRQRSSPRSSGTATRLDLVDRVQLLCQADPAASRENQLHGPKRPAGRRRFFSLSLFDATVGDRSSLRASDSGIVQPNLGDGSSLQRATSDAPRANVERYKCARASLRL
ncbi:hypothetical protein ALC56_14379 [Trachymyrmex septentrionalis]|uniref:Uncharacterized protein n=1 Tax=Trachymyrmex septentrionalis TaxID=34720 RepID=A0A195ETD7_9HYME|nr:hypothetical protein ALC56_14379 [Trachymyrmex septentrionalis]